MSRHKNEFQKMKHSNDVNSPDLVDSTFFDTVSDQDAETQILCLFQGHNLEKS